MSFIFYINVLNQIEEVSIDLWTSYKSLIQEMLPNAQVIADRFYVMKQINQELDARRKQEKRIANQIKNRQEREKKIAGLTYSKYPLLKKKESFNRITRSQIVPLHAQNLEESVQKFLEMLGKLNRAYLTDLEGKVLSLLELEIR
ncbi:transposase [Nostoc sp. ChiVER01]|uniref:transposase n=1 Tax=Nostoc sp. ChiVER01 TaxID=3075382 RepID=UPI003A0FE487